MDTWKRLLLAGLALGLLGFTVRGRLNHAGGSDAAAIRQLDTVWQRAMNARDAARVATFYGRDASLLSAGMPVVSGRAAIGRYWAGLMAKPGFALSFRPTQITVSKNGDMAYELGNYALRLGAQPGKVTKASGKYVVVWRKDAQGDWKAVVDAATSALP